MTRTTVFLALFILLSSVFGVMQAPLSDHAVNPFMVADEEQNIDCVDDGYGNWTCQENIPHSAPLGSAITG